MKQNKKQNRSPLKTAFGEAALAGVSYGVGAGIVGFLLGSYGLVLPAAIFAAIATGHITYRYEKNIQNFSKELLNNMMPK